MTTKLPPLPERNAPYPHILTPTELRALQIATWNAAMEAAAKKCEELPAKDPEGPWFNHDMSAGALECASAIRSMKEPV